MKSFSLIILTLLETNCLYVPPPLVQWRATRLSNHPNTALTGYPENAVRTLPTKFAAICPDTSSSLGIVRFFLANRDFAATNPTLTPECCLTTAYTTAEIPDPLASPKVCNSTSSRGSLYLGILLAKWNFSGRHPQEIQPPLSKVVRQFFVPRKMLVANLTKYELPKQGNRRYNPKRIIN